MSRPGAALPVLTAVTGVREAPLVSGLERSPAGVRVVRRCADLVELLAAAGAGLARAVVLSADLQRLDRDAVVQLTVAGVAIVGLTDPTDPDGGRRLTALGVHRVLPVDSPTEEIAEAVSAAVAELAQQQHETSADRLGFADPSLAMPVAPYGWRPEPMLRARPPGRLIAVWGPVGAPGRTTVAITLAAELAAAGQETLLIDADTYGASIAQSLGLLTESAGIAAATRAANQGGLDTARLAELAPPVTERLRVLTGLPQSRRWPELRTAALEALWQRARHLASWTVVDAGFGLESDEELMFDTVAPRRHGATLCALAAADKVLAVGAAEPLGLQRLLSGLQDVGEAIPAGLPVQVVVTKVRDAAVGGSATIRVADALERFAGVKNAILIPDDRPALDAAMLAGRSLTEHAPGSRACAPVRELAAQLTSVEGARRSGSPRNESSGSGTSGRARRRGFTRFGRPA